MERTHAKAKLWLVNNTNDPIIGDGKAYLLKTIKEEGSLNRACKKMKISYKHAWLLLKEIESSAGEPVIIKKRGGKEQGTCLTEKAIHLLEEYDTYTITAVITKEAADALGLKKDDKVVAVVKATEVMIGKE